MSEVDFRLQTLLWELWRQEGVTHIHHVHYTQLFFFHGNWFCTLIHNILKDTGAVIDLLIGEKKIVIQLGFKYRTSYNIMQGGEGWAKRVEVTISQEFTDTKVGVAWQSAQTHLACCVQQHQWTVLVQTLVSKLDKDEEGRWTALKAKQHH